MAHESVLVSGAEADVDVWGIWLGSVFMSMSPSIVSRMRVGARGVMMVSEFLMRCGNQGPAQGVWGCHHHRASQVISCQRPSQGVLEPGTEALGTR